MPDQSLGRAVLDLVTDPSRLRAGMAAARSEVASSLASTQAAAQAALTRTGTSMMQTGQSLTLGITVPVLAAGKAIVGVGLDFDRTLDQIVGLAGVSRDSIGGIKDEVLALGGEVGKTPQELAEAFYFVASAGFEAEEAMDVLNVAARASASGLGATQDVAKVLGLTINSYGKANIDAARAGDILTAAVRLGTAEADAFAGVLGRVVPTAATLGVTFDQVTAALAGMTITGLSAEESATSLNQVLVSLLKPTGEAEAALEGMGLSSAELRRQLREEGLIATLRTLEEAFGDNEQAAGLVFGNIRALRGATSLLGLETEQLDAIFRDTAAATGDLGDAYRETEGPARDLERSQARIEAAMIALSEDVIPIVVELAEQLAGSVAALAGWFRSLDPDTRKVVVQVLALAAAIGPVLIVGGALVKAVASLWIGLTTLSTVIFGKAIPALVALELKAKGASVPLVALAPILALLAYEADNASKYLEGTRTTQTRLEDQLANPLVPLWIQDLLGWTSDAAEGAEDMEAGINDALAGAMSDLSSFPGKVRDDLYQVPPSFERAARAAVQYRQDQDAALDAAIVDLKTHTADALAVLQGYRTEVEGAYQAAVDAEYDAEVTRNRIIISQAALAEADKELTKARKNGTREQIADAENRRIEILKELNGLKLHSALIGDEMQITTKLTALATGRDMERGLTSKHPETKAAYEALRASIVERLREIETRGGPAARQATQALAAILNPGSGASPLGNAYHYGSRTGGAYISGLLAQLRSGRTSVRDAMYAISRLVYAGSPPGPESPLHDIDKWGERTGRAWVEPLVGAISHAASALRSPLAAVGTVLGASFVPPGLSLAAAGAGIGVGGFARNAAMLPEGAAAGGAPAAAPGDTFNLYLPDARHTDPWAVLDRLPRYAKQAKAAAADEGWRTAP